MFYSLTSQSNLVFDIVKNGLNTLVVLPNSN
jgi:hypothetical protein